MSLFYDFIELKILTKIKHVHDVVIIIVFQIVSEAIKVLMCS